MQERAPLFWHGHTSPTGRSATTGMPSGSRTWRGPMPKYASNGKTPPLLVSDIADGSPSARYDRTRQLQEPRRVDRAGTHDDFAARESELRGRPLQLLGVHRPTAVRDADGGGPLEEDARDVRKRHDGQALPCLARVGVQESARCVAALATTNVGLWYNRGLVKARAGVSDSAILAGHWAGRTHLRDKSTLDVGRVVVGAARQAELVARLHERLHELVWIIVGGVDDCQRAVAAVIERVRRRRQAVLGFLPVPSPLRGNSCRRINIWCAATAERDALRTMKYGSTSLYDQPSQPARAHES